MTGISRKRDRHDRVAEAAAPVLLRLCEKVKWPSDLFVPAGDHMERRETSRPRSPFMLQPMWPGLSSRVAWLTTGVGRAYLAWCPEKERQAILRRLRRSRNPQDWLVRDPKSSMQYSPKRGGAVTQHVTQVMSGKPMTILRATTDSRPLSWGCRMARASTVRSIFFGSGQRSPWKNSRPGTLPISMPQLRRLLPRYSRRQSRRSA